MPVRNDPRFLGRAVESILGQTMGDFEFLIVNDGSTDETGSILDQYATQDRRIQVFHQENIGLTKSLNRLAHLARGSFIARQDSDDYSHAERFERQLVVMKSNRQLGLLGTNCYILSQEGKVICCERITTGEKRIAKRLPRRNCFVHGSVMFRSEVFRETGLYYEEYRYAEDYDLFLRISEEYAVDNIAEALYYYRINPASISVQRSREQLRMAMIVREACRMRRAGEFEAWTPQIFEALNKKMDGFWAQRRLDSDTALARGRNLMLGGDRRGAAHAFLLASLAIPNPKAFFHLLRALTGVGHGSVNVFE